MKNFKDLNINITEENIFEGEKIKIRKILDQQIEVYKYKIEDSKIYKEKIGHNKCLCLQIKYKEEPRIIFTSGTTLIKQIKQVNKEDFPFKTIIKLEKERFIFT